MQNLLIPEVEKFSYDTTEYVYSYSNLKQIISESFNKKDVTVIITNLNEAETVNVNKYNIDIIYSDTVFYSNNVCQIGFHLNETPPELPKLLFINLIENQPFLFVKGKKLKCSVFGKEKFDVTIRLPDEVNPDSLVSSIKRTDPWYYYYLYDGKEAIITISSEDGKVKYKKLLLNPKNEK